MKQLNGVYLSFIHHSCDTFFSCIFMITLCFQIGIHSINNYLRWYLIMQTGYKTSYLFIVLILQKLVIKLLLGNLDVLTLYP